MPLTILATCQVKVKVRDDQFMFVRVLLKPRSELSFVTDELDTFVRAILNACRDSVTGHWQNVFRTH